MKKTRRFKVGFVTVSDFLSMLNWQGGSAVTVPLLPERLPDDIKVVNAAFDWERNMFCLVLTSESFDEVPDGERAPILPDDLRLMQMRTVPLRQGKDGKWGVAEENDELTQLCDLADTAWGIIANAYGGDWDTASEASGWKAAATRWRDRYHGGSPGNAKGAIDEAVNTNPLTPELTCGDCEVYCTARLVWEDDDPEIACHQSPQAREVTNQTTACVKIVLADKAVKT